MHACMHACMHVCVVCVHGCVCGCACTCMCVYIYNILNIYIHSGVSLCVYLGIYIHIFVYAHMHVCIYIYMYMYISVCIYIYIYLFIVHIRIHHGLPVAEVGSISGLSRRTWANFFSEGKYSCSLLGRQWFRVKAGDSLGFWGLRLQTETRPCPHNPYAGHGWPQVEPPLWCKMWSAGWSKFLLQSGEHS